MNDFRSCLFLQGKQTEQLIIYGVTICNFRINSTDISERFKTKGKEIKKQVLPQPTEFADLAQPRSPKMNQYSD